MVTLAPARARLRMHYAAPSLTGLRVTRPGVVDPDDAALTVYQVPDPPATGDLDLPALEGLTLDYPCRQLTAHAVLAL